jgi:hypothetical protein
MRTLIVLCAGNRIINERPLYLNRHPEGMLLAEKAIEGIHPENYDKVIYTILKSAEQEYNAAEQILNSVGKKYPTEVVILEEKTSSPAETVYKTLKRANVEGEFAVRDSLNSITIEKEPKGNFLVGLDLTSYDDEVFKVRTKSFIILNEHHQVLDVVEKKLRSDVISVGLYGFKSVNDFYLAYEKLNDKNYPIKKLYLSHIISYLIGYKQRVFHCVEAVEHEDWGSEETWKLMQKRYEICFVNLDNLLLSDCKQTEELEHILNCKKNKKQSYVFYTIRNDIEALRLKETLNSMGIRCLGVICSCPVTDTKVLIENEKDLSNALIGV